MVRRLYSHIGFAMVLGLAVMIPAATAQAGDCRVPCSTPTPAAFLVVSPMQGTVTFMVSGSVMGQVWRMTVTDNGIDITPARLRDIPTGRNGTASLTLTLRPGVHRFVGQATNLTTGVVLGAQVPSP